MGGGGEREKERNSNTCTDRLLVAPAIKNAMNIHDSLKAHACLVRQKQSTKHSPLTQLPPYKKPNSVHGRCLEPCSAAALNETSPSMHINIKNQSPPP